MSESAPTSRPLNVLSFPLHDARLIEASAGTGKTYTISALVLRLLLGHGGKAGFGRALKIEEILVVTFTEAATAELRGRIRARIHEARLAFIQGQSGDPILSDLIDASVDRQEDARRLLLAEQNMDQAAIFTIHGFCQRMLKQHAFESGLPFESEFLTSEYGLKLNAVEDCWRERFYPMSKHLVARVMELWPEPASLLGKLNGILAQPQLKLTGIKQGISAEQWFEQRCALIETFKQGWSAQASEVITLLEKASLNGRVYSKRNLPNWLDELARFAAKPTEDEILPKNLYRFGQQALTKQTKKGETPPQHPLFEQIDQLLQDPLTLEALLLADMLARIRSRYKLLKAQTQQLSFDDLLSNLADALQQVNGEMLAGGIRKLFPVAMIDEFQDTDPQQYSIFSRIYLNQPGLALLLIGDPKQAIYGFRGADIFTYMRARREVSDHYSLPVNWRSTGAMVAATNQLFEWHDNPFIYRDAIAFDPVAAAPKHQEKPGLVIDGKNAAPLQFMLAENDAPLISFADYRQVQAQHCAQQIQKLLEGGRDGTATLGDGERIQASDIAVLVRTRREGELIAAMLAAQHIASVSLSSRVSVFDTPEAYQLYLQLAAIMTPTRERALRAALAAPLLHNSLAYLDQLTDDELLWQSCVDEYQSYLELWQRQGVLPMLYAWLEQRQVAARLLAKVGGDRVLTNLLHLGELLQQQSTELDGEAALLDWFSQQLLASDGDSAEQQLRLESDANLVQIVTIHKSKGLEYGVVLVPFALGFQEAKQALYHDENQELSLALSQDEHAQELAEQERLAEDLRLLYVAVTRAVYACYLGVGAVRTRVSARITKTEVHQSALGYLLQRGEAGDKAALLAVLNQLAEHPGIAIEECALDSLKPFESKPEHLPALQCPAFTGQISRNWWLTSYSALSRPAGGHGFDASTELAWLDKPELEPEVVAEEIWDIFHFPRGAEAGTLLHTLFEEIDFQAAPDEVRPVVLELLNRANYDEAWLDVVMAMRETVLTTTLPVTEGLPGRGYCLADVPAGQRLVELEFVLPIETLSAPVLNRFLAKHDPLTAQARPLEFAQIEGMLKGFIDLVFQFDGRYYVLDYKSNHLGDQLADYSKGAMAEAMIEHRYDFQYQLYALALHRFLRQRLADYDFETHFGGVYYLFMRGMSAQQLPDDAQTGVHFSRPSYSLIEGLDHMFRGERVALVDQQGESR